MRDVNMFVNLLLLQYIRQEELQTSLNPDIENALSNLHMGIAHQCPSLLPVLSQLTAQVNADISKHVRQKAELVGRSSATVTKAQPSGPSQSKRAAARSDESSLPSKSVYAGKTSGAVRATDPYVENIRNQGNSAGFLGQRGSMDSGGPAYASYANRYR